MMRRHNEYEMMVAAYEGLSPAERKEIDGHLVGCAACAAALAEYRGMDAKIRSLRTLRASAGVRVRFNDAVSAATHPAVQKPGPVRLAPPEPKISARRTAPAQATRALVRLALPLTAVLLFVAAIFVTLQLERPRTPGSDSHPAIAAPIQQAEVVKLVFTCNSAPDFGNYGAWAKVIATFHEENPDIEVVIKSLPITGTDAESYRQGLADLATKADVFCAMPLMSDRQRGVVADLAPYIANDLEFNPADFYPGLLQVWDNGAVLSVPTYFQPMLLKYRPELFDKAGVPYPQPGWTWEDFLAAAKALTVRGGPEVTQWGYYEIGGTMFTARLRSGLNPVTQTIPDYATAADTFKWFEKLYVEEPAAPVGPGLWQTLGEKVDTQAWDEMIAQGKVAMSNVDSAPNRAQPEHLAPFPETGYGSPLAVYYNNLVMSGQTSHPDQAYRLLSYLSRHLPDGEVPARRSLAEQASFWKRLNESSAAAYRYALGHLSSLFISRLPDNYEAYRDAALAVARGEKTAEQALAELDAQVHLAGGPTERSAATPALAAPTLVQTVVTEVVTSTLQPPAAARPADAKVITFACYRDRLPAYADAVKAFEAANPGVYVDLKPFEDYDAQFGQGAAALQASLGDVAGQVDALCDDYLPTRVRTGEGLDQYRDLSPFIAADASVDLHDYFEGALLSVQDGERTWGLPRSLWIEMIYYNQAALNQVGVAAPRPGWTQEEFLATAKALTRPDENGAMRWGFEDLWRGRLPFVLAQKPGLVGDGLGELTSPSTQAALQWYVDLAQKHGVMPVPEWCADAEPGAAPEIKEAWQSEPVMFSAPAGGPIVDSDNWRRRLGVVPFPSTAVSQQTTPLEALIDTLIISAATQHPDESWRWIVTASKVGGASDGSGVPASKSVLRQRCGLSQVNAEVCAAYEYALTHLLPAARMDPQVQAALQDAARAVLVDGKPVDVALLEAAQGR